MQRGVIFVEKMNGEKEPYDPDKLRKSLGNVGADDETAGRIMQKVGNILYNGIKTKELFRFIHKELRKSEPGPGLRYNLKRAMMELEINGGFVFEKFVGKLLEKQGYSIKMNQIVKGENVTHEIDVSAAKGKESLMVEVKHHDREGIGESIQTALYVYARFLEVRKKYTKPMLVTNTKFSDQSIEYSRGVGIRLMGWKYPYGDSLEENITKYGLYPITLLALPKEEKVRFMERNILTLPELAAQKSISENTKKQIEAVLKSAS